MTTFIEEQLTEAMHERVDAVALSGDLVGRTLRRQRRRTMIARTAYAGSLVGLAGVLTAGVLALTTAHNPHPVADGASPRVRLVAAVSASRGTSYRVNGTVIPHGGSPLGQPPMLIEGAFDPTTATGYERITFENGASWHEERLIDGDLYTTEAIAGQRIDWTHNPGEKHSSLTFDPKVGLLAVSADPMQLLGALTDSGATVTQTGPDTYHFVAPLPPRKGLIGGQLEGAVTLDSQGRIAKVAYEATLHGTPTDNTVLDGTLKLSDYGAPVTVERPRGTFEQLPGT